MGDAMGGRVLSLVVAGALLAVACQPAAGAGGALGLRRGAQEEGVAGPQIPFDPSAVRIRLDPIVGGLSQVTHMVMPPDGSQRFFILERAGRILVLRPDGQLVGTPFLNLTPQVLSRGQEQGLLGMAFHPRYAENGLFYLNYTGSQGETMIVRYNVSANPDLADPVTAMVLFRIPDPAANHNGGLLLFGPDGYMYIGLGDGGGAGDQFRNAQNMGALFGKMLRIDVDSAEPYSIPPDNPYVGLPGIAPEIWAHGLRNPWRYSFDRATADLYIADVGQGRYEWVHFQPAGSPGGQNYGWPILEGAHCFPSGNACDRSGLETPIAEYGHDLGCSITGGHVYRGQAYPQVLGVYFFADFCSGRIWSLDWNGEWRQTELLHSRLSISSFAEDDAGELYVTTLEPGGAYRLVFE